MKIRKKDEQDYVSHLEHLLDNMNKRIEDAIDFINIYTHGINLEAFDCLKLMYKIRDILEGENNVEIIEEKKIPKKLEIINEKNCKNNWKWKVKGEEYYYNISTPQKIIVDKINQVIDYLKSKGE